MPTDKPIVSVFDGCRYLYAEQLKGKRVLLTIKAVNPQTIVGDNGRTDQGFEVSFVETPKLYAFSCVTNRRALVSIFGTEDYRQYAGRKIVLYPGKSSKGQGGVAIRFAPATETPAGVACDENGEVK